MTLKVKYADFSQITRSRSLVDPLADGASLARIGLALLAGIFPLVRPVRLVGVSVSSLGPAACADAPRPNAGQLDLGF